MPGDPASAVCGFLPPRFFAVLRGRLVALHRSRRTQAVARSE